MTLGIIRDRVRLLITQKLLSENKKSQEQEAKNRAFKSAGTQKWCGRWILGVRPKASRREWAVLRSWWKIVRMY